MPLKKSDTKASGQAKVKGKGKGKKRARSPTPVIEDPSDVDDSGEQPPTKKQKDAQKAESSSLLIPVDETCPLAGENPSAIPLN